MVKLQRLKVICTILLLSNVGAIAQVENWKQISALYPNEDYCEFSRIKKFEFKVEKGRPAVESSVSSERLFFNEKGNGFNEQDIYYNDYTSKIGDINAYTTLADGKKLKVKEIISSRDEDEHIFFDDNYVKHFRFSGIEAGALTHYDYEINTLTEEFQTYLIFSEYSPIHQLNYELKVRNDVGVGILYYGDTTGCTAAVTQKGKYTYYNWNKSQLKGKKYQEGLYSFRYYLPHAVVYIKWYLNEKGDTVQLFNNLKGFYNWNKTYMTEAIAEVPDAHIKSLADSLLKSSGDTFSAVKSGYYWVQDNVKYIAFEDGKSGYTPHSGIKTYQKRYGDCKDKAQLIYLILKAMGVRCYHALVGTYELPYTLAELPAPGAFNHMIVVWENKGKWYFIDGTSEYLNFGLPRPDYQGKDVLVCKDLENFEVIRTPVISSKLNFRTDSVELTLKDKNLEGKATSYIGGYMKYLFLNYFLPMDTKEKDKYLQQYFLLGSSKAELTDFKVNGTNTNDSVLVISYKISIPDYTRNVDDGIFFNPHLFKEWPMANVKKDRIGPVHFRFGVKQTTIARFNVNGKKVELPANIEKHSDCFDYSFYYKQNKDYFDVGLSWQNNKIQIMDKEIKEYDSLVSGYNAQQRVGLIIK